MIYRLYGVDEQLLYVGISVRGLRRLVNHMDTKDWWNTVASARFEYANSRADALIREAYIIEHERPLHNVLQYSPALPAERPREVEKEVVATALPSTPPVSQNTPEPFMTVREAAAMIIASPESVRRWLRQGRMRGFLPAGDRMGWRIPEDEVDRFLMGGNREGESA